MIAQLEHQFRLGRLSLQGLWFFTQVILHCFSIFKVSSPLHLNLLILAPRISAHGWSQLFNPPFFSLWGRMLPSNLCNKRAESEQYRREPQTSTADIYFEFMLTGPFLFFLHISRWWEPCKLSLWYCNLQLYNVHQVLPCWTCFITR